MPCGDHGGDPVTFGAKAALDELGRLRIQQASVHELDGSRHVPTLASFEGLKGAESGTDP